jgi:hypothetical protein
MKITLSCVLALLVWVLSGCHRNASRSLAPSEVESWVVAFPITGMQMRCDARLVSDAFVPAAGPLQVCVARDRESVYSVRVDSTGRVVSMRREWSVHGDTVESVVAEVSDWFRRRFGEPWKCYPFDEMWFWDASDQFVSLDLRRGDISGLPVHISIVNFVAEPEQAEALRRCHRDVR